MRTVLVLILVALAGGCTRSWYRRSADRDTYHAVDERDHDPQWALPYFTIDPPPGARFADYTDPDHPPMPPDDPAADRYMVRADGMHGWRHWHDNGDLPWIEDPRWRDCLQLDKNGTLELTPERAISLGLQNSFDYQTAREALYFSALALTLDRFDFELQFALTNNTFYDHFGSSATDTDTLTTQSTFGFTKNLAAGGQLIVDFANTFVFQFAGINHTTATSNMTFTLLQPLLQNAGRQVRMEMLTEGERLVLYAVRDYARFRKTYSVGVTTGTQGNLGYLQLLLQVQNIRLQEDNLAAQERNLQLHEALLRAGIRTGVQVEQVYQNYERARLSLLQARANLETTLDRYKIFLGLPPSIPVRLDDAVLQPFQLNGEAYTTLRADLDRFAASYRELEEAPPLPKLQEGFKTLKTLNGRTGKLADEVAEDMANWKKHLGEQTEDRTARAREETQYKYLVKQLADLRGDLAAQERAIDKGAAALEPTRRKEGWEELQTRTQEQGTLLTELSVIQNMARVYLIRLKPVHWQLEPAVDYAREHRLDLMNQRGRVIDAYRQIEVTASALKAGLNVTASANIATPADSTNPVDFRASASSYHVGVQFDGPLNRMAQRNAYRTSQIFFQRVRRGFMSLEDSIQQAVRNDLRQLELEKLNFEIARQRVVSAARSVEGAERELKDPTRETSTQDYLTALSDLLSAKQDLIGAWVTYESQRIQLLLDLDVLQVDADGNIIEEGDACSAGPACTPSPETTARAQEHADFSVGPR